MAEPARVWKELATQLQRDTQWQIHEESIPHLPVYCETPDGTERLTVCRAVVVNDRFETYILLLTEKGN